MLNSVCTPIRRALCHQHQQLRHSTGGGSSSTAHGGDARLETIRRVLFEPAKKEKLIELQGEVLEQHETIERAWKLHRMRQREQRERSLERQFRAMNAAMTELEKTSDRLFKGALVKSRHLTYPKQAKIPTETPSAQGWDYAYKAPSAAESAA